LIITLIYSHSVGSRIYTFPSFSLSILYFLLNQAWQCSHEKEVAWNLLSLFTASGMLCLEISLIAFLLKDNYMNGMEALAHSFIASGIVVFVDTLLKVSLIFIHIDLLILSWFHITFPFMNSILFYSYPLLVCFLLPM